MRFRKLRIAWSVFLSMACVLLIVLWVRGYWWIDVINWQRTEQKSISLSSYGGRIQLYEKYFRNYIPSPGEERAVQYYSLQPDLAESASWWFGFHQTTVTRTTEVPIWFILGIAATIALLPWIHWRFTLRTLLLAISAVAGVLGLVVWAVRK